MMDETHKEYLLPDRHPQQELFLCDVADAVLKDDMASMEHPFFSLSKKPDLNTRKYRSGDKWLEVVPSVKGLATIYDKDILIYAISQLIASMRQNRPVGPRLKITAQDLLIFTNRNTGGKDYEALIDALERLDGTRIRTNVATGGKVTHEGFGLIDGFKLVRSQATGRIQELEVILSEWVFNSIEAHEVLTLHGDYFRLRRPLERRVYEIARKHCGQQDTWKISLDKLKKKCGSRSSTKEFRRLIRELVDGDHLPDYAVQMFDDSVVFINRHTMVQIEKEQVNYPRLQPDTYNDARIVAPGYDVYWLEQEWRSFWMVSGQPQFKDPDSAFIGFCRERYRRQPNP